MLVDATVEVRKAWNTWSSRPAELVFLPLGVRLTPVLFSSRAGKATTIRPGADLLLGRHGLDGEVIEFSQSGFEQKPFHRALAELGGYDCGNTDHMVTETLMRGMYAYWREVMEL